ncbi:MAG: ABC transporter substrate-binding protein [Candidatus Aureabacteria bacterium]|nr:ABC transporter substrate-binding protein [Candidatus Auribacterota bacterium]
MKIRLNFLFLAVFLQYIFAVNSFSAQRVAVVLSNQHIMYESIYEKFKLSPELKGVIIKKFVMESDVDNDYVQDAIRGGKFDAAFTIGTTATKMLKDIGTVPTVFSMVVNPKYFGFVGKDETSLPNLCGISIEVPVEDQFNLLKEIVPHAKRIGVIFDPGKSGYTVARALETAKKMGMEIREVPVNTSPEVPGALTMLEDNIDVLFAIVDDTVYKTSTMGHILLRCLKKKIPVFGFSHTITKAGALFSTYIDYDSIGEIGAERIRMILDGTPCKEIPFRFTEKWQYSLNLNVSHRLGIDMPHSIYIKADKVVNE